MADDKDHFDFSLGAFRDAGYATFTIDMPAHGESFSGARAQPDDEMIFAKVLEALAATPKIDPNRLGVIGGKFRRVLCARTAAFSPLVKVCGVFIAIRCGAWFARCGARHSRSFCLGSSARKRLNENLKRRNRFTWKDVIEKIKCPICLVHGTRDHICDFTVPYEIARRANAPLDIYPLVGADHEASAPSTPDMARPGVEWLKKNL